ncbi:hypothetical protein [Azospirillum sp. TSO22-1]|uniref:hypothetical protein n=1 Tax=Azospirillum sp. TSO22-1 TaxID=716789 RepID=UPI000D60F1FC|nr:hypothetical protein [Azospirillum sp. TSO22-1]PWC52818.1 hypothetical protein TSO221_13060 [Azospirillum sp. TSO22-1]
MRTPTLWATVALVLVGCAGSPGTSGSAGPAPAATPSGSSDVVAWPRLTQGQRLALRQGCRALHGRDFETYNACVAGENRSQQALEQGCAQRYAGNPEMIRNCQAT